MSLRFLLLFLPLVFLGSSNVFAQANTSFSNNYDLFIRELTDQMTASKRDDYKKLASDFSNSWSSEYIDAQRDAIMKAANEMKRKRLPIYPYFGNYLELLQKVKSVDVSAKRFYEWHTIYTKVMGLNQRSIDQYLKSSIDFFGSSAIYLSNAIKWEFYAPDYKFEFENNQVLVRLPIADLRCIYFNDSIVIRGTTGIWYPVDQRFEGHRGTIDWQRAKFPTDSIYANLKGYELNLKQFQITADSVDFYNKSLGRFIPGYLQDKCTANLAEENISYPRFSSYEGELVLNNIFKNVTIRGRYALNGNRYLAVGTREEPAEVFIYKNDTTTVKATSQQFAIRKTEVFSDNAQVNVLLNKDSIYHPGIAMRFTTADRKLLLFLELGSINKIPFSNSYHQLDTYCEVMSWKIDDPYIEFKMQTGLSEAIAVFTSKDYYDQREYLAAQGYATYNPLVRLFQYGRQVGEHFFPSDGFAAFMKLPLNSVRQLLIDLANQGFIYYDREQEEVTLLKKLYHYNNASSGRIDFDVIKFVSKTNLESNAMLNISTRELQINGVNVVIMSDTHTVFAVPRDRKMLIIKNRGIEFAGHVHVGTLDFYGEGFTFDYENFKIKMQEVDSLRFQIMTGEIDPRGQPVLVRIQNALENITGTLYIDDPRNRSSRSPIYRYPYFESMEASYVYYDRPDIQNGAYKRDLFYFKVEPFVLDSLDFAGSTSRLQLNGTLVSGIFPNIQEKLRFQDDLSLGFAAFTPEAGYPVYGGKGTYFNNVTLDKQGLHGYGKLQYLASMSESNNFVFRPENTSAQLDKYAIKKGSYQSTSYPALMGENVAMLWKAKTDSMLVYRGAAAFEVYDGIALFEGDLTYTPQQLYASGTLLYGRDKITSRSFALAQQKAFSEQLRLEIASNTPDLLALKTDDLEGEVDFTKRYGTFRNRTGETRVELPYNEYSAKLQDLEWDLRSNKLVLGATKDLKKPKTTFRSEHPGMAGFNFKAAFGAMDLNIFDLDLSGILEMRTADAIVLPDSGKARVTKEAKMMPLKNARLVFDSLKQEHQVYRASVDILGRKRYEAAGIYDYVNSNKQKQAIFLDIIRPNINGISVASGTISPDSNFMLNPGFGFSGGVAVSSAKKAISFNGLVRLTELPDTIRNSPFRYNSDFDPQETYIQVPEFKDDLNRKMFAGLMLNQANWQIYAAFGGSKMASQDSVLLEATGVVRFTEATKVYEIGPEKLILQGEGFGNTLTLNPASKQVTAKGKIRLGFDKDAIRFASGGEISHKYLEGKTDFLLTVLIDALLPDEALKIFYNQLVDYSFGVEDVNNDQDYVKTAFGNLLTGKAADRVITSLDNFGTIPTIEGTDYLFVLSNIDVSWDSDTRSFRSKETIGLANINGETIGKRLTGIFEIQILPTGRSFNLLLEPSSDVYFFFNYRNNRIYPVSSMMEFNDATKKGLGKKKKKGVDNKVSMGITQNRDRLVTRHSNWLSE